MTDKLYKPDNSVAYWDDGKVVHLCDGTDVGSHNEIRLLWTLCEIDVPANKALSQANSEFGDPNLNIITCDKCKKEQTK